MFLQVTPIPQTPPTAPGFDSLFTMVKSNPGSSILTAIIFLIIFVVIFKLGDILSYFKDRAAKKEELELKKLEENQKQNERHFDFYESMVKAVDNNTQAVSSIEKTFLISDAKSGERILGVESRLNDKMSGMESRIKEAVSSTVKEVVHTGKLDKIAASLDRLDGGEDSEDGVPK